MICLTYLPIKQHFNNRTQVNNNNILFFMSSIFSINTYNPNFTPNEKVLIFGMLLFDVPAILCSGSIPL